MRFSRAGLVALWVLFALPCAVGGEASVDDLVAEFTGGAEPVERSVEELEAAYTKVLEAFLPAMGSEDPNVRKDPEQTFQAICWRAGRPGAEKERAAVCRVIARKLGTDLPLHAQLWLIKQLEHIGAAEAVDALAAKLASPQHRVRERARRALQNNPSPQAGAALRKALAAADSAAWRVALINALACRAEEASTKPLIEQARSDDESVRGAAVQALARIGQKEAIYAIAGAMATGSEQARAVATDAYLLLADKLCQAGDRETARAIYRRLLRASGHVKCAAIIGLGRAAGLEELGTIFDALADPQPTIRGAGQAALELLPSGEVTEAIIEKVGTANPQMKVVLLRALANRGGKDVLPAFLGAAKDPNAEVRIAAYEGMGQLRAPAAVPALIAAIRTAEGDELGAAKAALNRIPGEGVAQALVKAMEGAEAEARVELIRCLAARRTGDIAPALLDAARDPAEAVRAEALKALRDRAEPKHVLALVGIVVEAKGRREREEAVSTLVAACRGEEGAEPTVQPLVAALDRAEPPARRALLEALARLGGEKALGAVRGALKDPDEEVRAEAIRQLPKWPRPEVASDLLEIARGQGELRNRVLALRGYVDMLGRLGGLPPERLLAMCQAAMEAAPRPEDRKMVLAGVANVGNLGALRMAQDHLGDAALRGEAEAAVVSIARAISGTHKQEAKAALEQVADTTANDRLRKAAADAISMVERFEDYITAWLLAGPYTQRDKGAEQLFDIAFPPEKEGAQDVQWRPMPVGTSRDRPWLLEFDKVPGVRGSNRAAYLRTRVWSPTTQKVRMELGSDDGVKVWLRGELVYAHNVTRPCSPGSDKKAVSLQEGWNDLMMKITQGGGEWAACLRFRATDGTGLEGIQADPAGGK
ncbi:MAG: HEAT repeat domain-containing protein [Candidatus Brocadiia bacterium]